MMRENLCEKVNDGDILFHGDERIQVFKANKKCRIETLAVTDGGKTIDYQSFLGLAKNSHNLTPGTKFSYNNGYKDGEWTFYGVVTLAYRNIKTVPVLFSGGELSVGEYRDLTLVCLLEGEESVYQMIDTDDSEVEMEYTVVVPAQISLPKPADITGFTKRDLIAYVIQVNGEGQMRDPILKKVAELEGKPWVPTSNTDYFLHVEEGVNVEGTLRKVGKGKHGRILFGLGVEGRARAAKVLARLGPEVGRF